MTFNMQYTNKQGRLLTAHVQAATGLEAQKLIQPYCLPGTVALCLGSNKAFFDTDGAICSTIA